ncbi:MAG: hypothetical protein EAX90_12155 [Candidatus Heimdallarchaeota archaeon]|nr:hypothetical protein [Candidatus Heimdallarchaeota archaeon]
MTKNEIKKKVELDTKKKLRVIEEVCKLLEERYICPEKAIKMREILLEKFHEGHYDNIEKNGEFASEIDKTLKEISEDKHLFLLFEKELLENEMIRKGNNEEEKQKLENKLIENTKQTNFGFLKLEILNGNIGYLDLRAFHNSNESFETAIAAMNFLSNANSVIIDLRNNGGGEAEMVQLLSSYFLKMGSQLNYIIRRYENTTDQYWTLPYVPGKRMLNKKLFLITSANTFSAAEDFIYALKCQKRVTIVGERTKGGGHPVDFFPILETFLLMLPTGKSYNPICKDNWEKKGIEPDVSVPAEEAFSKAYILALDDLILKEENQIKKLYMKLAKEEALAISKQLNIDNINFQELAGIYETSNYGSTKIIYEDGSLFWATRTAGKIKLTPVAEKVFVSKEPGHYDLRFMFEQDAKTKELFLYFFYIRDYDVIIRKKR